MSLNNLQNNYMEPVPTVESTVKAIMYDLIPAIKEKSYECRSIDGYYCSKYELDIESIGLTNVNCYYLYDDFGIYKDAVIQENDLEGKRCGIRRVFTRDEMNQIVSLIALKLKENGLKNCRVWYDQYKVQKLIYGIEENSTVGKIVRSILYGKRNELKTNPLTISVPCYAIRINAAW